MPAPAWQLQWQSVAEFLHMGGYGLYVWGSFAVTALALGWELLALKQRRQRALSQARQWRALHADSSGANHDPAP